jgi:glycosyltransferase involved in cell wall biosynthesis
VPPGVDTGQWTPALVRDHDGPLRILFVGGNFERKGGQLLLDWFRNDRAAQECELHIVTRDAVDAGARVFVHRDVPNNSEALRELVRSCDVFALPTYADCHSLASIEAMSSGLPVITTNVGGIPEIVVDGITGFIIQPGDAFALGDRLRKLISDRELRSRMASASRARAERYFDARTNVGVVINELVQVADKPSRERAAKRHVTGVSQT